MGAGQPQPQGCDNNCLKQAPAASVARSEVPVDSTSNGRDASPRDMNGQAPESLKRRDLSLAMGRYLHAAPQDGGSTYDLVHADLDARLNTLRLASELVDSQLANQGR